ncbi:amino acid transporter [Rhodosporidiobolus nylandii]
MSDIEKDAGSDKGLEGATAITTKGSRGGKYDGQIDEGISADEDLHRGLKARQISMIALGGAIGTGLVIGSGSGLAKGGPVGLLLAYIIMAFCCFSVMLSLGEMATFLPHKKGFSGYASRFVDPAMGFALGWNYLMKYLVVTPNNIVACTLVLSFWTNAVPVGAWIAIFLVLCILLNLIGVRVFGEIEFWMSFLKVVTLTGLIILGLVIDLGGAPGHDRIGFRYWRDQPFSHYLEQTDTGVFLGVWSCFVTALFAFMGAELVGVTFGEAKNPRKTVPAAIKRTFFRLLFFYIGSVFVVGLIVKATDPDLLAATKKGTSAAASPFVLAIQRANIKALPDIINACILMFVLSAANSFLAVDSGSRVIFGYFVALVTVFGALTWMSILVSHLAMMRAMKAQGMSRDELPWKAPGQPYIAWAGLGITALVTLFKGFDSFVHKFNHKTFITHYLGIPIYIVLYLGWKFYHKTSFVKPQEVDLVSGRREYDEDEAAWEELAATEKKSLWQKIWNAA